MAEETVPAQVAPTPAKPAQQVQQAPLKHEPQPVQAAKKRTTAPRTKKPVKKAEKVIIEKSKRKEAVARVSLRAGNGTLRINKMEINTVEPMELRAAILEPINLSNITKDLASKLFIDVNVQGGGMSSQAFAARGAIAKAMVAYAENDSIRKEYMQYDRSMLVDDIRRVEPKKFKGPKARARFQKSYR